MWMEAHNPVNSLESLRESLFHQNDMQSILASIFAIFSRDFDSFFRKSISVQLILWIKFSCWEIYSNNQIHVQSQQISYLCVEWFPS